MAHPAARSRPTVSSAIPTLARPAKLSRSTPPTGVTRKHIPIDTPIRPARSPRGPAAASKATHHVRYHGKRVVPRMAKTASAIPSARTPPNAALRQNNSAPAATVARSPSARVTPTNVSVSIPENDPSRKPNAFTGAMKPLARDGTPSADTQAQL